ncbi:MAG: PIN domain-containing protein [bacterium]
MKRGQRIYLDVCCLNRPFDDLSQERVRLEAEAVKSVLVYLGRRYWLGIGSGAIDFEVSQMANPDRHLEVSLIVADFPEYVSVGEPELLRGFELERYGFGALDALHLACAEKACADIFLTTDDALLRRALKTESSLSVRVSNPWAWLEEVLRR